MSPLVLAHRLGAAALLLLLAGCADPGDDAAPESVVAAPFGWTVELSEPLGEKLGAVVFGDFDPELPGDELAAAGVSGRVWVLAPTEGDWRVEQVGQAPGEMIQMAAADIDPTAPGDEIVLVGMAEGDEESGGAGAVNVLVRADSGWTLARLAEAGSLVHGVAVADVDPAPGLEIMTAGFDREAVLLRRGAGGVYEPQAVAQLPGAGKNVAPHDDGFLVACTDGSLVRLAVDEDGAWSSDVMHAHPAGLARLASDGERVLAAADDGALVLVDPAGTDTLHAESRKLRGAALANLDPRSAGLEAATVGYSGRLTVLRRAADGRWQPEVVHESTERLHHLAVGSPSSRTDGLALAAAGYGGRVVLCWYAEAPAGPEDG